MQTVDSIIMGVVKSFSRDVEKLWFGDGWCLLGIWKREEWVFLGNVSKEDGSGSGGLEEETTR